MLVALALLALFVTWLVVVLPLQYVVYLVAGAPARKSIASSRRAWVIVTDRGLRSRIDAKELPLPEGAVESGFTTQPLAFTSGIAAGLLFAASKLII